MPWTGLARQHHMECRHLPQLVAEGAAQGIEFRKD